MYTDADWNGDPTTTKSTNGLYVELWSPSSGHCWPITWQSKKQTCTSSSTAEAEVISLSWGLRSEGLPLQSFVESILGNRPIVRCFVDNDQALRAVDRGYSKKLRTLQRTHRCSIGVLHELAEDVQQRVIMQYCSTLKHKADSFTKVLAAFQFKAARHCIGMRPDVCVISNEKGKFVVP